MWGKRTIKDRKTGGRDVGERGLDVPRHIIKVVDGRLNTLAEEFRNGPTRQRGVRSVPNRESSGSNGAVSCVEGVATGGRMKVPCSDSDENQFFRLRRRHSVETQTSHPVVNVDGSGIAVRLEFSTTDPIETSAAALLVLSPTNR